MNHTPFRLERYFAAHEFTAKHLLCRSDRESRGARPGAHLDVRAGAIRPARIDVTGVDEMS